VLGMRFLRAPSEPGNRSNPNNIGTLLQEKILDFRSEFLIVLHLSNPSFYALRQHKS